MTFAGICPFFAWLFAVRLIRSIGKTSHQSWTKTRTGTERERGRVSVIPGGLGYWRWVRRGHLCTQSDFFSEAFNGFFFALCLLRDLNTQDREDNGTITLWREAGLTPEDSLEERSRSRQKSCCSSGSCKWNGAWKKQGFKEILEKGWTQKNKKEACFQKRLS